MTKEQIPSRISMPCPFGRNLGAGTGNITPVENAQGSNVNFIDGFPPIYGAPSSNSGKFVTRKEMNGLGNLATNDLFYHKCGGLNTFDADFCAAIGGYPYGAILKYVVGNQIYDVLSIKDNNKVDFTGKTPTTSQSSAGITSGSIDNINWIYCNKDIPTSQHIEVFAHSGTLLASATSSSIFGSFVAPISGVLSATFDASYGNDLEPNQGNVIRNAGEATNAFKCGGLLVKKVASIPDIGTVSPATPTDINLWSCVSQSYQSGSLYYPGGSSGTVYYSSRYFSVADLSSRVGSSEKSPSKNIVLANAGDVFVVCAVFSPILLISVDTYRVTNPNLSMHYKESKISISTLQ